jgi:hypothetical protein
VVRGEIGDRCVVAGVPARVIKGFDPETGWTRSGSGYSAAEDVLSEVLAADPSSRCSGSGPALSDPAPSDPALAGPAPSDPVLAGPAPSDPPLAEAVPAEPVPAERVLAEPVLAGPAHAEPALADLLLTPVPPSQPLRQQPLRQQPLRQQPLPEPPLTDRDS